MRTPFAIAMLSLGCLYCSQNSTTPNPHADRTTVTPTVIGPAHGMDPDRPSFLYEKSGVFGQPWGAANYSWPKQLFWENVTQIHEKYFEMINVADGLNAEGRPALLGPVAWGFDYIAATGGSTEGGIQDLSEEAGYKEYAEWLTPRKESYWAQNDKGEIAYEGQGYVSFMMPMLPEDLDSGMEEGATFGDWAGKRVGLLANHVHCQGVYTADFFVGLAYFTDYHPRVLKSFEEWTKQIGEPITLPQGDVPTQTKFIYQNAAALWNDFRTIKHSTFFSAIGKVILDSGNTPMVGGQISSDPAIGRLMGNDTRLMAQAFPAKYWALMVEVQSAGDRNTPPQWVGSMSIGANAAYAPDMPIGVMLDADIGDFWGAMERVGRSKAYGWKYLKHLWLSTGWTHVANLDGTVRRAPQSFMRSFWDAGGVDSIQWRAILEHIPKAPFGPALYYSRSLLRSFEVPPPPNTDTPNYYYALIKLQRDLGLSEFPSNKPSVMEGVNAGYWISDTAVYNLLPENAPAAWIVYESDRLSGAERSRLEAIAPIVDPERQGETLKDYGPLHLEGPGLNMLAFVDQNKSVIIMVSNRTDASVKGEMVFQEVSDGEFTAHGLLSAPDGELLVESNAGKMSIRVPANETYVWEIPDLEWVRNR